MTDARFPLHVRIIGVMYKDKGKMYITSVLWSDQTEVTVYRSMRDFKKLHRQMKKKFPVENPFRKSNRVIPRFGGRIMKLGFQKKTPVRSVTRVKALERYCTELLQCDPSITHTTDIIHFFLPKEEELHPEFAQNSVMIFQPKDIESGHMGADSASKRLSIGNVTHPFVTKTYRCVAPYETKDTKNRPFKVANDETLEVLIKEQAGWWLVENEQKRLAWFPAPYLEMCDEENEGEEELDSKAPITLYYAARSYTSNSRDELSVTIGTMVEVLEKSNNGWWLARYNGKVGYVPSMYLQPYLSPTFDLRRKLYRSTLNLPTMSTFQCETSYPLQPLESSQRMMRLRQSQSVEVLSESLEQPSALLQRKESGSFKSSLSGASDETDYSFSSSASLGLSLSGSDREENLRNSEPDGGDSGLSGDHPSPTSLEVSSPSKVGPKVPPRPQTQEILTRCTTYTRKAALATQARLFPERIEIQSR